MFYWIIWCPIIIQHRQTFSLSFFFLMRNRFRRAKVLKNTFLVLLLACSALTLPLKVFTIWFLRHSVVCLVLLSKEGRKAVNSGLMTHSTQILRRTHARPLVSFLTWVQAVPLLWVLHVNATIDCQVSKHSDSCSHKRCSLNHLLCPKYFPITEPRESCLGALWHMWFPGQHEGDS